MTILHARSTSKPSRIAWSSLFRPRSVVRRSGRPLHVHGTHWRTQLECAACRSDRDVWAADDLGGIGFCGECLESSRWDTELGGEC
jgi:hypothetical protein